MCYSSASLMLTTRSRRAHGNLRRAAACPLAHPRIAEHWCSAVSRRRKYANLRPHVRTGDPSWMPSLSGANTEGSASQPVSTGRVEAGRRAGRVMNAQLAPQPAGKGVCGTLGWARWRCSLAHTTGGSCPQACLPRPGLCWLRPPWPTCMLQQPRHIANFISDSPQVGGQRTEAVVAIYDDQRLSGSHLWCGTCCCCRWQWYSG